MTVGFLPGLTNLRQLFYSVRNGIGYIGLVFLRLFFLFPLSKPSSLKTVFVSHVLRDFWLKSLLLCPGLVHVTGLFTARVVSLLVHSDLSRRKQDREI